MTRAGAARRAGPDHGRRRRAGRLRHRLGRRAAARRGQRDASRRCVERARATTRRSASMRTTTSASRSATRSPRCEPARTLIDASTARLRRRRRQRADRGARRRPRQARHQHRHRSCRGARGRRRGACVPQLGAARPQRRPRRDHARMGGRLLELPAARRARRASGTTSRPREILRRARAARRVGGQEDMIIDVAIALAERGDAA